MLFADCYNLKKDEIARIIALSSEFSASRDSASRARSLEFRSYCAGLLTVAFCAAIESAIKSILIEFGSQQHALVAQWSKVRFEKMNGRIKIEDICSDYLLHYGKERVAKFKKFMEEQSMLRFSIDYRRYCESYNQLMTWRHKFAHVGQVLCTIEEVEQNCEIYWLVVEGVDFALS